MRPAGVAALAAVAAGLAIASPAAAATGLQSYRAAIDDERDVRALALSGFDVIEARSGSSLEVVATRAQARQLRRAGIATVLQRDPLGLTALGFDARAQAADGSYDVYRPYFNRSCSAATCYVGRDAGGDRRQTLYEEMLALANRRGNRRFVQPVVIGSSVRGVPILALRVTRNARRTRSGSKPAAIYLAAQHAREWITPEMVRRLAHLFVDNYGRRGRALGTDGRPVGRLRARALTRLVNRRELWFIVVANPDGYDFTFTPGNRLWRKNLRDNDDDRQITASDGVDLNRNFPTRWNYDEEGSSSDLDSETYRGPKPASEPETRALNRLMRRVGFELMIDYHSAAELLLYPSAFQVQTQTADDPIYRALSGTDEEPAIPGAPPGAPFPYDPDVASELYITNGDTIDHAHSRFGILTWVPEMDLSDPGRGGGPSEFEFQDSEADLQAAFEKNVPFAIDVARSAADPADPKSHLNNKSPSFVVERFPTSFGSPQTVGANVQRELGRVSLHWRINGGRERSAPTREWRGGERFGADGDVYYHRVRGKVRGADRGDRVRVWFEARRGRAKSKSFSYRVRSDSGDEVLILAAEDYRGSANSPQYPSRDGPFFLGHYRQALRANGIDFDVYDVDREGRRAPDPLGVLSHYDAVIWYTGNDELPRGPGQGPGTGVARLANDLILAVRSYLNEGGKLLHSGQYAGTAAANGFLFNVEGEPPYCPPAGRAAPNLCIPLSDDFHQYYLGAYNHLDAAGAPFGGGDAAAVGDLPIMLAGAGFGEGSIDLNGPESADNQEHVYSLVSTSSVLPPAEYPQFRSRRAVLVDEPSGFDPASGSAYAVAESDDAAWQRLRKTIDLTAATSASLDFSISYDVEADFDFVVVEAHTVGADDWTTLPDTNGNTSTSVGEACAIDWRSLHPFVDHYQTVGDDPATPEQEACFGRGTTGVWNAATGTSGSYQRWSVDLTPYAGRQVEISISYIQDFAFFGLGAFLDDVSVTRNGAVVEQTSFESDFGGFEAGPPPPGSEEGTRRAWERRQSVGFVVGPGVATRDTLYWGFGFEGISGRARRAEVMDSAMQHLGVRGEHRPRLDRR